MSLFWRLFCYDEETHAELLRRVSSEENRPYEDRIEVVFDPNSLKNKFWQKYMGPESIPNDFDYVWMQDGDMSTREMDWSKFWELVHVKYRPAIFMPAHHSSDPDYDRGLWHAFTVHYDHCDDDESNNRNNTQQQPHNNRYSRLQAVEVENFETCLPGFRRDVWAFVHKRFNETIPSWGSHKTDWGPGQVWCSLVAQEYLANQTANRSRGQPDQIAMRPYNLSCCRPAAAAAFAAASEGRDRSARQ